MTDKHDPGLWRVWFAYFFFGATTTVLPSLIFSAAHLTVPYPQTVVNLLEFMPASIVKSTLPQFLINSTNPVWGAVLVYLWALAAGLTAISPPNVHPPLRAVAVILASGIAAFTESVLLGRLQRPGHGEFALRAWGIGTGIGGVLREFWPYMLTTWKGGFIRDGLAYMWYILPLLFVACLALPPAQTSLIGYALDELAGTSLREVLKRPQRRRRQLSALHPVWGMLLSCGGCLSTFALSYARWNAQLRYVDGDIMPQFNFALSNLVGRIIPWQSAFRIRYQLASAWALVGLACLGLSELHPGATQASLELSYCVAGIASGALYMSGIGGALRHCDMTRPGKEFSIDLARLTSSDTAGRSLGAQIAVLWQHYH